jgi:hypothetical protein
MYTIPGIRRFLRTIPAEKDELLRKKFQVFLGEREREMGEYRERDGPRAETHYFINYPK